MSSSPPNSLLRYSPTSPITEHSSENKFTSTINSRIAQLQRLISSEKLNVYLPLNEVIEAYEIISEITSEELVEAITKINLPNYKTYSPPIKIHDRILCGEEYRDDEIDRIPQGIHKIEAIYCSILKKYDKLFKVTQSMEVVEKIETLFAKNKYDLETVFELIAHINGFMKTFDVAKIYDYRDKDIKKINALAAKIRNLGVTLTNNYSNFLGIKLYIRNDIVSYWKYLFSYIEKILKREYDAEAIDKLYNFILHQRLPDFESNCAEQMSAASQFSKCFHKLAEAYLALSGKQNFYKALQLVCTKQYFIITLDNDNLQNLKERFNKKIQEENFSIEEQVVVFTRLRKTIDRYA